MAQNLTETHNSRDFRKILILSLSLSLESRSCWNANAGEILPAGSRPRFCKIRTLSSISRFENESPKKLPSLTSLGLDSRSRFIDLSVHSQPCLEQRWLNMEPGSSKAIWRLTLKQGCESTDKSANRDRGTRTRIGSGASFFWVSLSNLVIDDNFRISNNLGLGLAANISTALPIQPVRDREIEIIL